MARLSQALVLLLLLLLASALASRISQHHVHKNGGHSRDLQPERRSVRETNDNKQLKDAEDSIPEDIDDNNQEHTEDTSQKGTEHKIIKAFFAELSSNAQVSSGATIQFDNVLVNEGGLYFGTSGQFACPDDGVYVFAWSLRSSGENRGVGALAVGRENIRSGPKTSYHSASSNNGNSQMVSAVQCRPMTTVTVRSMSISPPNYYSEYSSFAGFRLSTDAASAVAFTAELSEDVSLFPGGKILFDNVVSNVGGHYDDEYGFFRCPDDGVYAFSVSTYHPKASNQWSVSRLMLDGTSVLQGPMTYRATTSTDSGSSSLTVLIQCQHGKDFYVESDQSYEFDYAEYGADLTSFSGFRLCSQCDDLVAFSAVLTENGTTSGVAIPFSNVLLTRGNAYNPMTGVFTCPDDALYMFQWSATSIYGDCNLDLNVNDSRIKRNYMTRQSSTTSYGTSGTSSQSAVIRCSAGDTVSLRGSSVSTTRILLAGYTTFSGYRLPGQ